MLIIFLKLGQTQKSLTYPKHRITLFFREMKYNDLQYSGRTNYVTSNATVIVQMGGAKLINSYVCNLIELHHINITNAPQQLHRLQHFSSGLTTKYVDSNSLHINGQEPHDLLTALYLQNWSFNNLYTLEGKQSNRIPCLYTLKGKQTNQILSFLSPNGQTSNSGSIQIYSTREYNQVEVADIMPTIFLVTCSLQCLLS